MKEVVFSVLRDNLWEGFTVPVTFFKKRTHFKRCRLFSSNCLLLSPYLVFLIPTDSNNFK